MARTIMNQSVIDGVLKDAEVLFAKEEEVGTQDGHSSFAFHKRASVHRARASSQMASSCGNYSICDMVATPVAPVKELGFEIADFEERQISMPRRLKLSSQQRYTLYTKLSDLKK